MHLWSESTVGNEASLIHSVGQLVVDSQNLRNVTPKPVDNEILLQLEALSRRYCYRLHSKRLQLYRNLSI